MLVTRNALFFSCVFLVLTFLAGTAFGAPCPLNPTNPSITICTPAANSSVSNPVTITAGSTDSAGVIAMAVYVDNTLVSKVNGNQNSTTASFSAGSHYLVVQLWDNAGRIIKQPEYFTVTTSTVPTISFTANPSSITAGQSSTLSWTTTNATSVTIDNGIGSQPVSGSVSVSPSATTTYTLTATGAGGTSTARVTVNVGTTGGTCSPAKPAPSVTICSPANGSTVPSPVHVLAVPNSNNGVIAMAVYFDNNLVYKGNVNSVDQYINASNGSHYVVVQYWDNSGNVPAKASANITVGSTNPPPTISFSASPTSIASGQSSTLTWSTSNATSVSIDNGVGSVATSGAVTVNPTATTTYTLTATGPGGTATAKATVTVSSGTTPPTVSFSASPTSISAGQSSTLTWSTTNATSVSIDNGIGSVATSGSQSVSPTSTTTYTLTATGPGGTTTGQATVTVGTTTTCTPASPAPSVTICSPTNGSTVPTPVHVVAVPNSNNGVIAMAVYFDNTLKYKANVNKVDTLIDTTTGSHYIVVQFWNNNGAVPAKASVNVTVGNPPPSGLVVSPSTATVLINDTQQFTATNNGASVPVTWSIDGLPNGNTTVGTIDANGIYTAPSTAGTHQVKAVNTSNTSQSATATVNVVSSSVAVTTYHNDAQRTGANLKETILKPGNVNSSTFGKLATYSVDGQVYAQPLYVPDLTINGSAHNVLYIATEHDSVYAFDADGKTSTPLWKVSLLASGQTTVASSDSAGIKPEIGITSTPVIDINNNVMYVVAYVDNSGTNQFWLHALDLHTGAERFGGPKRITATVPGTGADSVNGQISLSGGCYQRSGLALANGNIYIAFAHCSHGWVLAYNAGTLAQSAVYNTTPNGAGGTIWMGGGAPAIDASGNVYVLTGTNFGSTADSGYNNAFMRFTASLGLTDYFMPSNNATLVANDVDLGAGGPMILPDNSSSHPHEIVGAGKDGRIFLIDRDNMGKFDPNANHVIQTIQSGTQQWNNFHDTPAFWNGNLYYHSNADVLRQFKWSNGLLSTSPYAVGPDVFNAHGATPSVSANGNTNGIVWELKLDGQPSSPAILYAYDATNVANVLYKSSTNAADAAPNAVKFTVPTIVNGKVYVAGGGQVAIYGLK